jgi:hypothetical protein
MVDAGQTSYILEFLNVFKICTSGLVEKGCSSFAFFQRQNTCTVFARVRIHEDIHSMVASNIINEFSGRAIFTIGGFIVCCNQGCGIIDILASATRRTKMLTHLNLIQTSPAYFTTHLVSNILISTNGTISATQSCRANFFLTGFTSQTSCLNRGALYKTSRATFTTVLAVFVLKQRGSTPSAT